MKKFFPIVLLVAITITIIIASRPNTEKFGTQLKYVLEHQNQDKYVVYVYLKDKGPDAEKKLLNPLGLVTQRSLDRRAKVLSAGQLVDITDVPVYNDYLNEISKKSIKFRNELKWFNSVSVEVNINQLYDIADLNYVEKIELVERFKKNNDCNEEMKRSIISSPVTNSPLADSLNYGTLGLPQISQIKVNLVHNIGVYGQGVMIGHFDAGITYPQHPALLPMNVYKRKDFQTGDTVNLAPHSHGQATLSLVGGYAPGNMIGPAFQSRYILCRTEVDPTETPIEMDYWIAAAAWVDSLGADVITSSLGYLTFDPPYSGYTWQDMNGHTMPISIAATLAAHKGIVVNNSAGNNGSDVHNTLNGPADADSIVTVGSVGSTNLWSNFSSIGPTTDVPARIKPEVMALGEGNQVSVGANSYSNFGSGTSYACPLTAGVSALILSANKNLTPLQVIGILKKFASNTNSPNNSMGWGVIDAQRSVDSARKLDNVSPTILHTQPFANTTNTGTISLKARMYDNGIIRYTRTGESPRLYYRKKVSGVWSSFTSVNHSSVSIDTFYFQIPASAIGTTVEYYFAAQDIALPNPLVSTLPAGGSGINPPGTTAPANRFSFNISTGINEISTTIPSEYKLFNNYPNPFNPSTKIKFNIKESGFVTIKVYDVLGKEVATLVNENLKPGTYEVPFSINQYTNNFISSGIYFYRLQSGSFNDVKRMMLIK